MGVVSINLQSGFVEIALLLGCSHEGFSQDFRSYFSENTSGRLLLNADDFIQGFNLFFSINYTFEVLQFQFFCNFN